MECAAVPRAARVSGAGAMHALAILARLRERALPPRAPLPRSAPLLLGAQASDGTRRMGEGGGDLPAAARAPFARLAQRLRRSVAVLITRRRGRRGANVSRERLAIVIASASEAIQGGWCESGLLRRWRSSQ